MAGRIVLAATPIGNVADASVRLRDALAHADVVAAEDTRRTVRLAGLLGVTIGGDLIAVHDHNEGAKADVLVARALAGQTVLLVTDAGMPTVSDPGYRVVRAAIAAGVPVEALPGPSAVLTALAVSGLATDRFCFEGFLPRKAEPRHRALAALATETRTMVFFESAQRLAATLEAMAAQWEPDRAASVSRELTKLHEETRRGTVADLAAWAAGGVKGEVVIVVAGTDARLSADEVIALALERVEAGQRASEVAADLASVSALTRRDLYAAVLAARERPRS